MRKRKDELEQKIEDFLIKNDQPGVKFRDIAVIIEKNHYKRVPKKKNQKEEDCVNILKHYGITNAEKICNEMLESLKGDEIPKNSIKLKDAKLLDYVTVKKTK